MMRRFTLNNALLLSLAGLFAQTAQAYELPAGTVITGLSNGLSDGLLGLDSGYAAGPGSHITTLNDHEPEFISADFQFLVDFAADGSVRIYGNSEDGTVLGSFTLNFSFAGLSEAIGGFSVSNTAAVSTGSISSQVLGAEQVSLSFSGLSFALPFDSFTLQLSGVAAVPEPASFALLGLGLGFLAAARRQGRGVQA